MFSQIHVKIHTHYIFVSFTDTSDKSRLIQYTKVGDLLVLFIVFGVVSKYLLLLFMNTISWDSSKKELSNEQLDKETNCRDNKYSELLPLKAIRKSKSSELL